MYISPSVLRPLSAAERLQLRARMNELAERAAERFLSAVRPIYGATKNGDPNHIGSAVLLDIRGMKLLLTAAHVVDANEEMTTTLYIGGAEGRFVEIKSQFRLTSRPDGDRNKDQYDFAVGRLSEEMIAQLGTGYVTEGDIATKVQPGHLYTAVGFPNSKNRWSDPKTKKTVAKGFRYSSTCRFNDKIAKRLADHGRGEHHIFLGYNKQSRSEEGIQVSSVAPRGLSGGAIIDAGRPSDLRVFREEIAPVPRLIGMTVERWKDHQVLVGTRMSVILRMILDEFATPTSAPSSAT